MYITPTDLGPPEDDQQFIAAVIRGEGSKRAWSLNDKGRPDPCSTKILERRDHHSAYYDSMKPIFWALRIIGRLPYCLQQNGEMKSTLKSGWMVYSMVLFFAHFYLSVDSCIFLYDKILTDLDKFQFDDYLYSALSISVIYLNFFAPFSIFVESKSIAKYSNKWRKFEATYSELLGEEVPSTLKYYILVATLFYLPFLMLIPYIYSKMLHISEKEHLIAHMVSVVASGMTGLYWLATMVHIRRTSKKLNECISKSFFKPMHNRPQFICQLRSLWIELSDLTRQTFNSTKTTALVMAKIITLGFLIASYAIIFYLISLKWKPEVLHFIVVAPVLLSSVYIQLNVAHATTDQVGNQLSRILMRTDLKHLDSASQHEVNLFVHAISVNYPHIDVGGYYICNRPLMMSWISNIVTYLIVLAQFRSDKLSIKY